MKYSPAIVLAYWRDCGLPEPVTEHRFHPERKWRFDFAWTAHRVALEVQGGIWTGGRHARGAGLAKEYEKLSAAACLGWRVLFVQPRELCMATTAASIKSAMSWSNEFLLPSAKAGSRPN